MYQTGYRCYTTFSRGIPYYGGFCKWYYVAKEELSYFPPIDPATQFLSAEPTLSNAWCGPVRVPNDTLGFEEISKRDARGVYYQQKVSGYYPGDDPASRINLENMPWYQFVIVGKLRAGGMYLVIGNDINGLTFDADFKTIGNGTAGHDFTFSGDFINKALILPQFLGDNVIPAPGSNGSGSGDNGYPGTSPGNDAMIIPYSTEDQLQIPWTAELQKRFGVYPTIEVWYTEEGTLKLNLAPIIMVDAFPPNTTMFTVTINAPGPGIVVLK